MRIFAFGCSLTQYFYNTWADVPIHANIDPKGYEGSIGSARVVQVTHIY